MRIEIHRVHDMRLGHLAVNTELTRLNNLILFNKSGTRTLTIYYFGNKNPPNHYLVELWKRNLPYVSGHWGWLLEYCSHFYFFKLNSSKTSTPNDVNGHLLYNLPPFLFSTQELKTGASFVNSVSRNEKFVCLNVRDRAYLDDLKKGRLTNHDYRDSKINSYLEATETLAKLNYTVIRMGKVVEETLGSKNQDVIDYANNGMRSEFLDVYLGAHCAFSVSTGSGWDGIPTIFRRPMLWVNHLPIFDPSAITLQIVIYPKNLVNKGSLTDLNLKTILDKNILDCFNLRGYQDAGVEIRDLSSEELVEAVTEMAQRVEGTFVETPEQREMQAKLNHVLSTHPKLQPSPNYYPIRAQFASCFLSRYPNFLDGLD